MTQRQYFPFLLCLTDTTPEPLLYLPWLRKTRFMLLTVFRVLGWSFPRVFYIPSSTRQYHPRDFSYSPCSLYSEVLACFRLLRGFHNRFCPQFAGELSKHVVLVVQISELWFSDDCYLHPKLLDERRNMYFGWTSKIFTDIFDYTSSWRGIDFPHSIIFLASPSWILHDIIRLLIF